VDDEAILIGVDLFTRFGRAYPGLAGFLSAVFLLLALWGIVCAQLDPGRIRAAGWPKVATFVEWGQRAGALAIAIYKARKGAADASPRSPS
jgi:hypothetical protein